MTKRSKGRPRNYEEEELLIEAMKVFSQKGYQASTARDLMDAMNIGQGSFYSTFKGGKIVLYQKTLKLRWEMIRGKLREGVRNGVDPIVLLKKVFYNTIDRSPLEKMNGCYVGNALVEFRSLDIETRNIAIHILNNFEIEIKNILVLAKEKGSLGKDKDISKIASCLINLWNGTNISQRANPDEEFTRGVLDTNFAFLLD